MVDEQRIERLHVQIGQLFEANLALQVAVKTRDALVVDLRAELAEVKSAPPVAVIAQAGA